MGVTQVQSEKDPVRSRHRASAAAAGGIAGLTWAAGFREYMASLVGEESKITWFGTFGTILLPAAAIGALFGWAEHRRANGEDLPLRRTIAAAPIVLGILPLTQPGAIATLRRNGQGSAASGVALAAIGGGYAIAGGGPAWTRVATGVLAAAVAVGAAASVPSIGGSRLALAKPRGALTAVLGSGSVLTLALAASVPFRGRPSTHGADVDTHSG